MPSQIHLGILRRRSSSPKKDPEPPHAPLFQPHPSFAQTRKAMEDHGKTLLKAHQDAHNKGLQDFKDRAAEVISYYR